MNDKIDEYLRELVDRGRTPGIQYAWSDSDGTIYSHSAGWAGLAERRPMTGATAMMAYSMSKVLTAYTITVLARLGHLHLDDALARYLPWQPYGPDVTIRQLLEHRAGIPNPTPLRWVHLAADHAAFDEPAALERTLRQYAHLRYPPGTRTHYSNIGYWLLGRLVSEVAGQPFVSFAMEAALPAAAIGPAEIAYQFPVDGSQAHGYLERFSLLNLLRPLLTNRGLTGECQGRWLRIQDHYVNGPAFGGCIGTATGFCKLARHLINTGNHGFGWSRGASFVQKEGGGAGFRCMLRLNWEGKFASAVMSNATGLNVSNCLDHIESIRTRCGEAG
ncbi:MAG: beta-lactamase family protein [Bryobacteraceae bacterium]|nr:beta-lactamase family protein [Bryobacteraceae bacterium]